MPIENGPSIFEWIVGVAIQTVTLIVVGVWTLFRTITNERKEIDRSIANVENDLRDKIAGVDANSRQTVESAQRLYSATVEAVKQELHEHVIYVERNFARRDSFYKAIDEMKKEMRDAFDRIEKRMDLENGVDKR